MPTSPSGRVLKPPLLKLLGTPGELKWYEVKGDGMLLGRSSDSNITLLDRYISRHHARLLLDKGKYRIVDLESKHGTFVNGEQVVQKVLEHGDCIRLGRLELEFVTKDLGTTEPRSSEVTAGRDLQEPLTQLSSVVASPEYSQYSELEKMSFILDFQYQWGQRFSSNQTFQHILKSALQISGAERGFVLVKREAGFDYTVGMDAREQVLPESDFRASRSVVAHVADSGKPVFHTEGIEGDLAKQDSIVEMHLQAVACLPLSGISSESNRPEILGILYLDSTKTMHRLSGLDQKILNKLAAEAGNVLEKLELIGSVEERQRFERELEIAQRVQKSLLPPSLPQSDSFQLCAFSEPTRHVGGDFYDFLQVGSDELLGVLADVSGKGVPAALLSSMVQGALDVECRAGIPFEEILDRLNQLLCERSRPRDFVTLFLFSLDSEGRGKYVGAGHNPAYLFRASTGKVEQLISDGLIVGAFNFARYQCCPLQLDPGDVLVVYSDGVTEAADPGGEFFGQERLLQLIESEGRSGAQLLQGKILKAIEHFTEGMSQTDDITLLLIQRQD